MSSNPVYAFFATPKSFGPFLLRMLLAVVFFVHGSQKAFGWFGGEGWAVTANAWAQPGGMNLPMGMTALVIFAELAGAAGMFLGLLTRLAALGLAAVMAGAILLVHTPGGFAACEYPLALLVICLALLFTGGGRLSMDRGISGQLLPSIG